MNNPGPLRKGAHLPVEQNRTPAEQLAQQPGQSEEMLEGRNCGAGNLGALLLEMLDQQLQS
ncbi:hypothetical protein D3C80_1731270 [compost metagenome]